LDEASIKVSSRSDGPVPSIDIREETPMSEESPESSLPRRRTVLKTLALSAVALVAAGGGLFYLFPGLRKWVGLGGGSPFQPVAAIDSLPKGQWKLVSFDVVEYSGMSINRTRRTAWVSRGEQPDAITVLSPVCPHAGCQINWKPDKTAFVCPCHGGTFDSDGNLKSGPPKRSMDTLAFRVEEGQLLISWPNPTV